MKKSYDEIEVIKRAMDSSDEAAIVSSELESG